MSNYAKRISPAVTREREHAALLEPTDPQAAFGHLERAHVLGQESTWLHVRAHLAMLGWAFRQRAPREAGGQILRIVGASTKTAMGLVPAGNTGGANISPFRRLPIPNDLQREITLARSGPGRSKA